MQTYTNKALFLDRDGVINEDLHYVHKVKDFIWKNNVKKAIKFLNDRNLFNCLERSNLLYKVIRK
jgi:D-glycero-D-manno-heptose 1,7-bisphosphate phosphatase